MLCSTPAILPFALACLLAVACGTTPNTSEEQADASGAKPTLRVLFVGNSYTSFSDMPTIVETLSETSESPVRIEAGMHAPGGQTWEGHDSDPELSDVLTRDWDYVVLQDQSAQAFSVRGVKPALVSLATKVRAQGAEPLLYMTWARSPAKVGTLAVFEQNLALGRYYEEAGEAIGAPVSAVGRAWERALRNGDLTLHRADGSHPNELGSYLAACVLFESLTGVAVTSDERAELDISAEEAAQMQRIAAETAQARIRPQPPLLGHWPLTSDRDGNDIFTTDNISLGQAGRSGERSGTSFSSGGFGAIPYFQGLRTPNITVALWAHRDDWSLPTPHPTLAETLVARFQAYELYQRGTQLSAEVHTTDGKAYPPIGYDVASLSPGWHHVALTYDGSTYALWIDGESVATEAASGALRYEDPSLPGFGRFNGIAIAGAASGGGTVAVGMVSGFRGSLADLRIYEESLDDSEIAILGQPAP